MLKLKHTLLTLVLAATSVGAFTMLPTQADSTQTVDKVGQSTPVGRAAQTGVVVGFESPDSLQQPVPARSAEQPASEIPTTQPTPETVDDSNRSQSDSDEPAPGQDETEVEDVETPADNNHQGTAPQMMIADLPMPTNSFASAAAEPKATAANTSASYDRSAKGHRVWLDIRFDLDEYDDVVVNYGDGTTQTLRDHLTRKSANVATDGTPPPPPTRWRTDHSYELALIAVEHQVSITWIGDAGVHVETFTARPQAVFDLTFQPLTFTAEASCDWHSPGDFTVKWDQGRGWYKTPKFHLNKGESKTFDEFAFTRGGITIDHIWLDVIRLRFTEHDRLVSRIVAPIIDPTRWKAEFKGLPPRPIAPIVQILGDHTVPIKVSNELGHECYVSSSFDVTLDLYEG